MNAKTTKKRKQERKKVKVILHPGTSMICFLDLPVKVLSHNQLLQFYSQNELCHTFL